MVTLKTVYKFETDLSRGTEVLALNCSRSTTVQLEVLSGIKMLVGRGS